MKALSFLVAFTMAICGLVSIELPASATSADVSQTREVSTGLTAGREAATQSNTEEKPNGFGTLTIVNQYGGGVYYLTIEPGSKGGPVRTRASSRAQPVKRLEDGKMYGTTVLIADGGSKSYSLGAFQGGVQFRSAELPRRLRQAADSPAFPQALMAVDWLPCAVYIPINH